MAAIAIPDPTYAEAQELTPCAEAQELIPPVPETIEDTGLSPAMIEQLILKILYFRGETLGRDLSIALGLKFSVIEESLEMLKRAHLVTVKRSLGMGNISAVLLLTEAGRAHARDYLEACQYADHAPVPLYQYAHIVKEQRLKESWLTIEALHQAYKHMVVTPELLAQIGPAVNSGKSFLIYGQPGNGKTYLAEALFNIDTSYIYVPYAIESQGMIIRMFDPIYHHPLNSTESDADSAVSFEPTHDGRWFRCRRPFIVSGGELSLAMLDLSYNPVAKFYDAPLQLKANNGIYLVDDFGRQKASPAEVLNRWIVPMERRVDYLTFQNGTKMSVPFETFLIFSTNLKPAQLGDEAFLRRIQYKMLLRSPSEPEFGEIFRKFAASKNLEATPELVHNFLEKYYRKTGKPRRRCHPRDVLLHAVDLLQFERRPYELTEEVLDRACASCFADNSEIDA
jgi:predicted ATPase with chaperone activity